MASSRDYLDYLREQLSGLDDVTYRPMMGEYIIYYKDRIIGGLYDDRFLVKPTRSALELMPNAEYQKPYEGAREMLVVAEIHDRDFLQRLFEAMVDELPVKKRK